jgi:hypothetical protein
VETKAELHEVEIADSEIDLLRLARQIWKFKLLIVLVALVFVVVAGLYVSLTRILAKSDIYEYIIQTDFQGRDLDQYPNESPFRLSDIIAPAILSKIYTEKNIEKYGVDKDEFISAFTVAPYTKDRVIIKQKFELLFNKKKATLAELQEI